MKEGFCRSKINPPIKELILQFIISSNGTLKNISLPRNRKKKPFDCYQFYPRVERIDLNRNSNKGKFYCITWDLIWASSIILLILQLVFLSSLTRISNPSCSIFYNVRTNFSVVSPGLSVESLHWLVPPSLMNIYKEEIFIHCLTIQ